LRAKHIVDYDQKPEYIYLGPDELISNEMIVTFMSNKPGTGINHKYYRVTSLGINIYMEEVLKFLGILSKRPLLSK